MNTTGRRALSLEASARCRCTCVIKNRNEHEDNAALRSELTKGTCASSTDTSANTIESFSHSVSWLEFVLNDLMQRLLCWLHVLLTTHCHTFPMQVLFFHEVNFKLFKCQRTLVLRPRNCARSWIGLPLLLSRARCKASSDLLMAVKL